MKKMRTPVLLVFIVLILLVGIVGCGKTSTTSSAHDQPAGLKLTPEPGTNGQPMVNPTGHYESFFATQDVVYVGSDNYQVYAMGAKDGSIHWRRVLDSESHIETIANGILYATSNLGTLYALNASTGATLWTFKNGQGIVGLILMNDMLYVGTAGNPGDPAIYVLRASDGSVIWHKSYNSVPPVLNNVVDDIIYCVQTPGPDILHSKATINALSASDGHLLWQAETASGDGMLKAATVVGGTVYFTSGSGSVYALQEATGKQLWHVSYTQQFPAFPSRGSSLVANGIVYTSTNKSINALDASNGKLLWQYAHLDVIGPQLPSLTLAHGVIYFALADQILALRADNGSRLWIYNGASVMDIPGVVNGILYAHVPNGLLALHTNDGTRFWEKSIDDYSTSTSNPSAEVFFNIVYVGPDSGIVQALSATTGQPLWHYVIPEMGDPMESAPIYSAFVSFTSATTYEQALKLITGLGLQTTYPCAASWVDEGEKTIYQGNQSLLVSSTVAGAPLWVDRLKALSAVKSIKGNPIYNCPLEKVKQPPFLKPEKAGTYVRVTFAANSTSYDTALAAINNLGFRLAAPCYELARAQGKKPQWNSMSQEESFGKTHTLLLATTSLNATTWVDQLEKTSGVETVDAPVNSKC